MRWKLFSSSKNISILAFAYHGINFTAHAHHDGNITHNTPLGEQLKLKEVLSNVPFIHALRENIGSSSLAPISMGM